MCYFQAISPPSSLVSASSGISSVKENSSGQKPTAPTDVNSAPPLPPRPDDLQPIQKPSADEEMDPTRDHPVFFQAHTSQPHIVRPIPSIAVAPPPPSPLNQSEFDLEVTRGPARGRGQESPSNDGGLGSSFGTSSEDDKHYPTDSRTRATSGHNALKENGVQIPRSGSSRPSPRLSRAEEWQRKSQAQLLPYHGTQNDRRSRHSVSPPESHGILKSRSRTPSPHVSTRDTTTYNTHPPRMSQLRGSSSLEHRRKSVVDLNRRKSVVDPNKRRTTIAGPLVRRMSELSQALRRQSEFFPSDLKRSSSFSPERRPSSKAPSVKGRRSSSFSPEQKRRSTVFSSPPSTIYEPPVSPSRMPRVSFAAPRKSRVWSRASSKGMMSLQLDKA